MNKNKIILSVGEEDDIIRKDIVDVLRCKDFIEGILINKGYTVETLYLNKKDFLDENSIKIKIIKSNPLCIFNLFEGFHDDPLIESEFARILEEIKIPFTGNSSETLKFCLDKSKVKQIFSENGINYPKGIFANKLSDINSENLSFPIFIKPQFEDASLGIDESSLVLKKENLEKIFIEKLEKFPLGLSLEEFIPGKEYSIGVLGNYPYEILGISVIDYSKYKKLMPYLTYSSKWESTSVEFKKIAPEKIREIDANFKGNLIKLAINAGKALKCRGYFRVDLRERKEKLFVLDVNPNPDINQDSGFMKQACGKGYTYDGIIEKILGFSLI